jgi:hypothetical protein
MNYDAAMIPFAPCRRRLAGLATVLITLLASSACNRGSKECRQWRLQAEVPTGTKVTTSTRATPDRTTLEQAQWTILSAPDQQPAAPLPWADEFPEVTTMMAPADGVASSDAVQILTVVVADGCD